MQELQHQLEEAWKSSTPFVAYHLPDYPEVYCMMQKDRSLNYLKDYNESGFVFAPFKESSPSLIFNSDNSEFTKYKVVNKGSDPVSNFDINQNDKQNYLNLLEKAINHIKTGKSKKIVLSRVISSDYDLKSPYNLLLKLITNYPQAFTYVWYHPEIGLWAGASPETLAKTYRNRFETMALAGTKPIQSTRQWTAKEKTEQQLVTDTIVASLTHHGRNVKVSERKTEQAGDLFHLRTDIQSTFETHKLGDILTDLHPTPAVCGLPKDEAYRFISSHETYDRQFYTGFLGELNMPKQTQRSKRTRNQENQAYKTIARASNLFVNLRCLSYEEGRVHIYVGGGITKDSIPLDEWEETKNKSRTMLKVL
ncbi:chorismate-binding protein [Psychroflexus tropicus]|uniref:chorismate-binding protein n=1 Tax=Psychroflexus tropicus TaxID=197345 RepID=UPI0003735F00|nr:chorismate-binding protein [Psychroflexus tropicus]